MDSGWAVGGKAPRKSSWDRDRSATLSERNRGIPCLGNFVFPFLVGLRFEDYDDG